MKRLAFDFGASLSVIACEGFGLDSVEVLNAALQELGIRRLRLMSYWSLHEPSEGKYDFSVLDKQMDLCEQYGARVSLCIGYRQPRWPENHQPSWAKKLYDENRLRWAESLVQYIETVVNRYKDRAVLAEWQLENEALNRRFGVDGDFSRSRLKKEFEMVKEIDPDRPIVMTTSNNFGIPLKAPNADRYGFSLYRVEHKKGNYTRSRLPAIYYRLRALAIIVLRGRKTFIHELQCEPWGPKSNQDLSIKEAFKSMSPRQLAKNIEFAKRTKLFPIDMWGLEWWYWLKKTGQDNEIWDTIKSYFNQDPHLLK